MCGSSGSTFAHARVKWMQAKERGVITIHVNPDRAVQDLYPADYKIFHNASESIAELNRIIMNQ